ncbi:MAG: DUF362 domain-containing protein [Gemmatimonadota bacterium]|nr:MAG: DUF362 domain-containing protein [Gemmatimonadota bacterium]
MYYKKRKNAACGAALLFAIAAIGSHLASPDKDRQLALFHPALLGKVAASPYDHALVGIAPSEDSSLGEKAAPLESDLTYEQVDAVTRLAVQRAGGLDSIIQPGDWVVLKPNIVTFYGQPHPDGWIRGQDTDLRVIRSLIQQLIEEGDASRITVAEGGVWRRTEDRRCSEETDGWKVHWPHFGNLSYEDMIAELDAMYAAVHIDLVDLNYDDYTSNVPVPGGGFALDSYSVPNTILNCDRLISVAAMKTHHRTGVSLTHKNYVGIAPAQVYGAGGWSKWGLPHDMIERVVCDLFSYHPADLGLIECFWGTEGYGPQWGNPIKRNMVLASTDPVAVDAVGAYIMGFNPWDIDHLHWSHNKGYGFNDLNNIILNGSEWDAIMHDFEKARHDDKRYNFNLAFYYGRGNRTWLINGKYSGSDLNHDYLGGLESTISPTKGDITSGNVWSEFTGVDDHIDLLQYWNESASNCITYAFTRITSDCARTAYLRFGSDDGIKIWLNGEVVDFNANTGGFWLVENADPASGNYGTPVHFLEGENRLLLKIKNGYGDYGFSLCVCEEDGDTPLWIRYHLNPPTPSSIKGDVNRDYGINIMDALMVINIILQTVEPSSEELWSADCNGPQENCKGDGGVDVLDALKIVNLILELDECP